MKPEWTLAKGNGPLIVGPDLWERCDADRLLSIDKFFGDEFKKYRLVLDELARYAYLISPSSEAPEMDYGFCINAHDSFLSTIDAGSWGEHLFEDWNYVSLLEIMVFFARNIVRDFALHTFMERPIQTVVMYELDSMGFIDQPDPGLVEIVAMNINKRKFGKLGEGNFLRFKDPAGHGIDCRNWSLIKMQDAWGFEYEFPEDCQAYTNFYTERMED